MPSTYSLKSSSEFVDLLRTRTRQGKLASLDVSSLFTNVPVERTIEILARYAYHHDELPPPDIPEHTLCAMLRLCTKKAPFRCPKGRLFYQADGIAMGSPLGVLFAQAFMAAVEEEVLSDATVKPFLYVRYIDDILVDVKDDSALDSLKTRLEVASGLNFTVEDSIEHRISFLDVAIDASNVTYATSVHRKPTDAGKCLNANSECPARYKVSVIRAYVNRALKHCSSWPLVHQELRRVKQILADNEYDARTVDKQIQLALSQYLQPKEKNTDITHTLFYKNTMSPGYKADERVLHSIVHRNCKAKNPTEKIKLAIYYQNPTTSSLILDNNPSRDRAPLKQKSVVYHYKCTTGDCALLPNSGYIGLTTTSLSRRLTMHLQQGGPKTHTESEHGIPLTRKMLTENTKILERSANKRRLSALEAIFIRDIDPTINKQANITGTLNLFRGPALGRRLDI